MIDLISRKAAIEATCYNCTEKEICDGICDDTDRLRELPAVEPKHVKWIPCKKQMPEPNESVRGVDKHYLVQNEYGDMMVASYNAEGNARWWKQMYQCEAIMDEIVAWMELPEECKEGDEDEHTD